MCDLGLSRRAQLTDYAPALLKHVSAWAEPIGAFLTSAPKQGNRTYRHVLVLQRHLGWVAVCAVVADAGLVLASSSPAGPGPDVLGLVGVSQNEVHEQSADFR